MIMRIGVLLTLLCIGVCGPTSRHILQEAIDRSSDYQLSVIDYQSLTELILINILNR